MFSWYRTYSKLLFMGEEGGAETSGKGTEGWQQGRRFG